MADLEFPEGFQIDTRRAVTFDVRTPADLDLTDTLLVVRTPDGHVLFEGPLAAASLAEIVLNAPATAQELHAEIRGPSGARVVPFPVADDGSARLVL